jgi:cytochrome c1
MKTMRLTMFIVTAALVAGCDSGPDEAARQLTGGDSTRGPQLMITHGCTACHTVPGVRGADSLVGPPLTHMASRTYIGGVLTNSPQNMAAWLKDPPAVDPKTAMPNLRLTDGEVKDISAYLYTLR